MSKYEILKEEVSKRLEEERTRPFKVSVMGQTGVGKSSLVNALFGTSFETDPVRPCTKEVQVHEIKGADDSKLQFFDMPGIGEAGPVDQKYIEDYIERVESSDVVIWAIHADVRSVAQDKNALETIVSSMKEEEMESVLSKITFVMTKSDLIMVGPWILAKEGEEAVFAPSESVEKILREKAKYLQDVFINPYQDSLTSQTYNDGSFKLDIARFEYDEFEISYDGMFTEEKFKNLKEEYPEYTDTFRRLYDNHRVLACSSHLKYNLYEMMLVVLNKLGEEAIVRFKEFLPNKDLNRIPFHDALSSSNLVYLDRDTGKTVFNPRNEETPTWWYNVQ